jgi:hypothetical protein
VAVEALEPVLASREEVEEQPERGARRVRAAVLAVDVVGENQRLHLPGLVVAVEEVAETAGQEGDHAADLRAGDAAEAAADAQRLDEAGQSAGADVRRRFEEEGLEVARELLQLLVDAHERAGVGRGEALELADGPVALRPPRDRVPVEKRHEERRVARHHLQSVPREAEVADDLRPEHARDVRRGRRATAGRDLLGDARAADDRAALEHERREPRPREVRGRRQAVVPGAHDDRVVGPALLIRSHRGMPVKFKLAHVDSVPRLLYADR